MRLEREALAMDNAARRWQSYKQTMVVPANLWGAAKANNIAELSHLLASGAEINARDPRGYSALMLAAYAGHYEAFEYLLQQGADPNSKDSAGNSVLMGAAFKGQLEMVRQLLLVGADANAQNHAGLTALDFASQFGRSEVATLLGERPPQA